MPDPLSYTQAIRYNRQIVLPQIDLPGQETLAASRILVIGVGGLGCPAAQLLCSSGVGHLTLADKDRVAVHNLPRQTLFSETDVGKAKVWAAYHRLHTMNSDCRITVLEQYADEATLPQMLTGHDVILDCTDNALTRQDIAHYCWRAGIPLITAGAVRFEGQLMLSEPGSGAGCYNCLGIREDQGDCVQDGIFSPVVSLLGTYQAMAAMQRLIGCGSLSPGKLMIFDAMAHAWQTFAVPPLADCPTCQQNTE